MSTIRDRPAMKIPLGVRVEPEMKAALEKAAKQEKRTLTAQVEVILQEWLDARKKKAPK
jgi:hypothetical protein